MLMQFTVPILPVLYFLSCAFLCHRDLSVLASIVVLDDVVKGTSVLVPLSLAIVCAVSACLTLGGIAAWFREEG